MKHIATLFNGLLVLAVASALFAAGCAKDPGVESEAQGQELRFEVAAKNGWQTLPQSRSAEDKAQEACPAGVFTLRSKNPSDTLQLYIEVYNGTSGQEKPKTRATPIGPDGSISPDGIEYAPFHNSFGAMASVFAGDWDETSCTADYMYDVEVTKASGWKTKYTWPDKRRNIRFWAYASYGCNGVSLPPRGSVSGAPSFDYTVPENADDQTDLCFASTGTMQGISPLDPPAPASLEFKHALCSVHIVDNGSNGISGHISKVSLKNVYGHGVFSMKDGGTWSGLSGKTSYSLDVDHRLGASNWEFINPFEQTFMMIPQTLPEDAELEIVFTDDWVGQEHVLSGSIGGFEWPMGEAVLFVPKLEPRFHIEYVFEVTVNGKKITWNTNKGEPEKEPFVLPYQEGTYPFTVLSYRAYYRDDILLKTEPIPWYCYVTRLDYGGTSHPYNPGQEPKWVKINTNRGPGGMEIEESSFTLESFDYTDIDTMRNVWLSFNGAGSKAAFIDQEKEPAPTTPTTD